MYNKTIKTIQNFFIKERSINIFKNQKKPVLMLLIFTFIIIYHCSKSIKRKRSINLKDTDWSPIQKNVRVIFESNENNSCSVDELSTFNDYLKNEERELYEFNKDFDQEKTTYLQGMDHILSKNAIESEQNPISLPDLFNSTNDKELINFDKDIQSILAEGTFSSLDEQNLLTAKSNIPRKILEDSFFESNYNNFLKEFKNHSFLRIDHLSVTDLIKKEVDEALLYKIQNVENKTLFRLNSSMKQAKSFNFKATNIMYHYMDANFRPRILEFLDQIKNLNCDVIKNSYHETITHSNLNDQSFLDNLQDSFEKFFEYQYNQIGVYLEGSKFASNYILFRRIAVVEKCKNSHFYAFILNKSFNLPEFSFMPILFPEMEEITSLLESHFFPVHICKKIFFVFEYIFFKSAIIKNEIKEKLVYLSQDDFCMNYQQSETLYRYILDIRSLLYIAKETVVGFNCYINEQKSRRHLMRTFFDFIRVVSPRVYDFFSIDEFFFTEHTLNDLMQFETKDLFLKREEGKNVFSIRFFKKFSVSSKFKNLFDFDQKIFEEYSLNENDALVDFFKYQQINPLEIKNYFDFKKSFYMKKLIEALEDK